MSRFVVHPGGDCSFCGKTQDEVRVMVGVTTRYQICDECIELCIDIIHENDADDELEPTSEPPTESRAVALSLPNKELIEKIRRLGLEIPAPLEEPDSGPAAPTRLPAGFAAAARAHGDPVPLRRASELVAETKPAARARRPLDPKLKAMIERAADWERAQEQAAAPGPSGKPPTPEEFAQRVTALGFPTTVDRAAETLADRAVPPEQRVAGGRFQCSFCGRFRTEVEKLISGPRVFICNDCVDDAVWAAGEDDE